ncbi:MAG TPA: hypothetical protein VIY48_13510 [Candidatus Paceibacterota bacterium]
MLSELKFVMGAVAKRDLIPGMTHFCIEDKNIRAYNGHLGIGAPINLDIDCKPHAQQLIKAVSQCSENHVTTISMMGNGKLRIMNGDYTVFVDCISEETPHVLPEGDRVEINGEELRKAFENLQPFMGTDASRPWTNGVLLHDKSAYATNNIAICQFWLGTPFPLTLNVPGEAIKEVLRVKEIATHLQVTSNSVTFHFSDGRWIRSGLWDNAFLGQLTAVMDRVVGNPVTTNLNLFEGLRAIAPFVNKLNEVYFDKGSLATHLDDGVGARYHVDGLPDRGCFVLEQLQLLEGVATKIDLSTYPAPCLFYGDNMRGAIVGRHMVSNDAG